MTANSKNKSEKNWILIYIFGKISLIIWVFRITFHLIYSTFKDRQQSAQRDLHFWSYLMDYVMYINLLYVKK